ncbi:hypothetical protein Y1Q_0018621 [Alligator mississippiensis]|uniref:Uncharacterized protein n=1 Tax=Alligator mississippiensis TaxID=8496 RepID=A0A151NRN6_ALLMI|nr:hypothetical protein Y1Q_0018621 [Alligator mississippiensis]
MSAYHWQCSYHSLGTAALERKKCHTEPKQQFIQPAIPSMAVAKEVAPSSTVLGLCFPLLRGSSRIDAKLRLPVCRILRDLELLVHISFIHYVYLYKLT